MKAIAAIFDLDHTLLDASSGSLFYRYLQQTGGVGRFFRRRDLMMAMAQMVRWRLGLTDMNQAMQHAARAAAGIHVDELWPFVHEWFDAKVVHAIRPEARDALERHRQQGHIVVICSAASQFSVLPVAAHLGIEHTIYTEWLQVQEQLTGEIRLPIAYGTGKVHWMQHWAFNQGVDLARSTFYTDHHSDQPLLDIVDAAVAVCPSRKLRRLAHQRGWQVVDWGSASS